MTVSIFKSGVLRTPHFARPPQPPFCVNHDHPLADGLVGCWPMGLSAGATANEPDITRYSRDAAITNATLNQDWMGPYRSFSTGSTQYVRHATNCGITDVPLTIAAWAQTSVATGNLNQVVGILSQNNASGPYFAVSMFGGTNDRVRCSQYDGTTAGEAIATLNYSANTWHHCVGVFASDTSRIAYMDGANSASNTTNVANSMAAVEQVMWGENLGFAWSGLSGAIRFGCIWNRALSDVEVWQLWAPDSRWDMYYPLRTRMFSFPSVSGGITLTPTGHVEPTSYGAPAAHHTLPTAGYANTTSYGTPGAHHTLPTSGHTEASAFGAPATHHTLPATSHEETTAYGTAAAHHTITTTGHTETSTYGAPSLLFGSILATSGVEKTTAYGAAAAHHTITTTGPSFPESFGGPTLDAGLITTGHVSAAAFGAATVQTATVLSPTGFATVVVFGGPTLGYFTTSVGPSIIVPPRFRSILPTARFHAIQPTPRFRAILAAS